MTRRPITTLLASLLISSSVFISTPAVAVPPDEQLQDPALEAKAREISKGLRCLVCQNQSIDDSDAELAKDLRRIVRERLLAGDNEAAIEDYVVSRYGEFVLLKPRLNASTALLWASPVLFVLAGLGFAVLTFRRKDAGVNTDANADVQDTITPVKNMDVLDHLRDD